MLSYSHAMTETTLAEPTEPEVLVVDDDLSTREGLQALLEAAGWPVRCFASAREFLAFDLPERPSCLVLDVGLPDLNGLDLQAVIRARNPGLPIIFITGSGDIPMTVKAMKAGAADFLTKPLSEDELMPAIERAIEQSGRALAEKSKSDKVRRHYDSLSKRERQVMALVVTGLLNKQVAWELGISEITVKAHRGRVMEKMGARSFAQLVTMGAELGLPTGEPVLPN